MAQSFLFYSNMAAAPWGGSEELWSRAALSLVAKGHRVEASVTWWPELHERVVRLGRAGIRLHVRKPPSLARRVARRLGMPMASPTAFLESARPDLALVSHGSHIPEMQLCEALRRRVCKHALLFQMATEMYWPIGGELDSFEQALRGSASNFYVAKKNAELVERQLGSAVPRFEHVWNPPSMPLEETPALPAPRPDPNAPWSLACVARLEPWAKGQDVLFEVLRRPEWRARNVHASLYGSGAGEEGLRRLARKWDLTNVTFRGYASDVSAIWQEHEALILPSRYEGTPLSLIEAMLCGRPAIVTDAGGNVELVEEGRTGFIAEHCSAVALHAAMERAWAARHSWAKMGADAQSAIRTMMPADPVEAFVQRLLQLAQGVEA